MAKKLAKKRAQYETSLSSDDGKTASESEVSAAVNCKSTAELDVDDTESKQTTHGTTDVGDAESKHNTSNATDVGDAESKQNTSSVTDAESKQTTPGAIDIRSAENKQAMSAANDLGESESHHTTSGHSGPTEKLCTAINKNHPVPVDISAAESEVPDVINNSDDVVDDDVVPSSASSSQSTEFEFPIKVPDPACEPQLLQPGDSKTAAEQHKLTVVSDDKAGNDSDFDFEE